MIPIRNLVIISAAGAAIAGVVTTFATLPAPPGTVLVINKLPPVLGNVDAGFIITPPLPPGSQIAVGNINGILAVGTAPPNPPVAPFTASAFRFFDPAASLVGPTYATDFAVAFQSIVDTAFASPTGVTGPIHPLTYDPRLSQVAANFIADSIARGGIAAPSTNLLGQTPIQQVLLQFPSTNATAATVLGTRDEIPTILGMGGDMKAAQDAAGIILQFMVFFGPTGPAIFENQAWTHYGFAVVVQPQDLLAQKNETLWVYLILAREN